MASSERYADLHMHSYFSDGIHSPTELIEKSAHAGLDVIALCDHDNYHGVAEAIAAGEKQWIEVIPAVEISTRIDDREFHMLAYYLDLEDQRLTDFIDNMATQRRTRLQAIIDNLYRHGIDIHFDDIKTPVNIASLGRSHLAHALVNKKIANNLGDAFSRFIGDKSKAYEPHASVDAIEVLDILRDNGAVPVLAHPKANFPEDKLNKLVDHGLQGVEGFYPTYTERDRKAAAAWAQKYNLLITGGSDFHYEGGRIDVGSVKVGNDLINALSDKRKVIKR